jgi:hypothetical protein
MSSQQQQERTTRSMEYGELDDAALRENKGRVVKGWTVGARLTASPTLTYVSIHSAAETTIVRTAMIEKATIRQRDRSSAVNARSASRGLGMGNPPNSLAPLPEMGGGISRCNRYSSMAEAMTFLVESRGVNGCAQPTPQRTNKWNSPRGV